MWGRASIPLLAAILGPTGSGKTALSLVLAQQFGGELVNCDSVALYREFDIGSAKPDAQQRSRAPHHLLDVATPNQYVTAGEYARLARGVVDEIIARGHLPILVGGTGLYVRALLEGLFAGPTRSEPLRKRLRHRAAVKGPTHLHSILQRFDPVAAAAIHANDQPKLIRAIEVCLATRRPISELWKQGREPLRGYRVLRIGLNPDRSALYDRINARARKLFECGLVEETERLLNKYGDHPWPMRSLGYKQAAELLRGHLTREEAIQAAQQAHRNYAKRQMTWFRRDSAIQWLNGFGDDPVLQRQAAEMVSSASG